MSIVPSANGAVERTTPVNSDTDPDTQNQGRFAEATAEDPCPACGHSGWCSWLIGPGERLRALCMRYDTTTVRHGDGTTVERAGRPSLNGGWTFDIDAATSVAASVARLPRKGTPARHTAAAWQIADRRPARDPD